jgi:hypothetical protein
MKNSTAISSDLGQVPDRVEGVMSYLYPAKYFLSVWLVLVEKET